MTGRKFSAGNGYRYGFNGKENDNEVKGDGNNLNFGARIYDARLGRWFNTDPQESNFPGWSTYSFTHNNPIYYIDPDGESPISIFAKLAAKAGLKKAAKEFVETQVKKRLGNYMKYKWAKQLADDALTAIDLATSQAWWEYALEVVPVVGDAYGGYKLTDQGVKV